jgi:hypothetical protein
MRSGRVALEGAPFKLRLGGDFTGGRTFQPPGGFAEARPDKGDMMLRIEPLALSAIPVRALWISGPKYSGGIDLRAVRVR